MNLYLFGLITILFILVQITGPYADTAIAVSSIIKHFDANTKPVEIVDAYKRDIPFREYISKALANYTNPSNATSEYEQNYLHQLIKSRMSLDIDCTPSVLSTCDHEMTFVKLVCDINPSIATDICNKPSPEQHLIVRHLSDPQIQNFGAYAELLRMSNEMSPSFNVSITADFDKLAPSASSQINGRTTMR